MSLLGSAFLIVWNDVTAEAEDEFNQWYTAEHVPERVGVPGFLRGRRFVDWQAERHRYSAVYETRDLAVLASPGYLERLNAPTPWTTRMMDEFRNFVRGACQTVVSQGDGIGGAAMTLRFAIGEAGAGGTAPAAQSAVESILGFPGVTGVHLGVTDQATTNQPTAERELREKDGAFDAVLIVEGVDRRFLADRQVEIETLATPLAAPGAPMESGLYDLMYCLAEA